jgi:hypothetical protein
MIQVDYDTLKDGDIFLVYFAMYQYRSVGLYERLVGDHNTTMDYTSRRYNDHKHEFQCAYESNIYEANFENIRKECIYFKLDSDEYFSIIADRI